MLSVYFAFFEDFPAVGRPKNQRNISHSEFLNPMFRLEKSFSGFVVVR